MHNRYATDSRKNTWYVLQELATRSYRTKFNHSSHLADSWILKEDQEILHFENHQETFIDLLLQSIMPLFQNLVMEWIQYLKQLAMTYTMLQANNSEWAKEESLLSFKFKQADSWRTTETEGPEKNHRQAIL